MFLMYSTDNVDKLLINVDFSTPEPVVIHKPNRCYTKSKNYKLDTLKHPPLIPARASQQKLNN